MAAHLEAPQISKSEMLSFNDAHFSSFATDNFARHFLCPDQLSPDHQTTAWHEEVEEEYSYGDEEAEEDDGLGYYPDGVKRTLTDEQIAIFRHSEMEAIRRKQESGRVKKATVPEVDLDLSEGEIEDAMSPVATRTTTTTNKKKKKRKKGKNNVDKEPPIDLRKRTWDVVGTGLETLDYGDEERVVVNEERPVQRRRISYDD